MSSPLLTSESVAKRLEVTVAGLCFWRQRGVGPEWYRRGRHYFYPADKFEDYLRRIGPVPSKEEDPRRTFFAIAHSPKVTPERHVMLAEYIEAMAARLSVVEERLAKVERRKRVRQRAGLAV